MGFAAALLALPAAAQFQFDDFNDGNDNGWSRYNVLAPFGLNATFSFPNGGYRIQTMYVTGMPENPGRAGSTRPEVYTNFYVAVDIVNWSDTVPQSAGILARVQTPGLQTTTGYSFTWDRGNPTNATAGDVDISRITGEAPSGVTLTIITNTFRPDTDSIHLEPGQSYRFVFLGIADRLEGRVYQLPNTNTPVVAVFGTDSTYPSGQNGMVTFDNSGGQAQTDVTFDNFYAIDSEPPALQLVDLGFSEWAVGWPAYATSWKPQSSGAVTGPWTDVDPSEVRLEGERFLIYLPAPLSSGATTFYRLIHP